MSVKEKEKWRWESDLDLSAHRGGFTRAWEMGVNKDRLSHVAAKWKFDSSKNDWPHHGALLAWLNANTRLKYRASWLKKTDDKKKKRELYCKSNPKTITLKVNSLPLNNKYVNKTKTNNVYVRLWFLYLYGLWYWALSQFVFTETTGQAFHKKVIQTGVNYLSSHRLTHIRCSNEQQDGVCEIK